MNQNRKIVWVLGSGFSVPLGGPTLNRLFTSDSKAVVTKIFPKTKYPKLYEGQDFTASYQVFDYGLGHSSENKPLPRMWSDAEEYLDYLDTAITFTRSPATARVNSVIQDSRVWEKSATDNTDGLANITHRLVNTTRRIIAAECSVFLEGTDTNLEKWQPYIRWAKMLDDNHTIITFNYDRVLETLLVNDSVKIRPESFAGISTYKPEEMLCGDFATVLKLHGSVDWRMNISQTPYTIDLGEPLEALDCDSEKLMIATPGPTKRLMVNDYLAPLWNEAEKALNQANAVFFIGYRFPPTDAEARGRLLGALMKNKSLPDLRLFTVLGPDDNPDNRRLEALLRYATKGRAKVLRLPLWAQDFMSVYDPDFIFE